MKKVLTVLLAVVLVLTNAVVCAEEAAAKDPKEPQIFAWADQGNVQLTKVGDYLEELPESVYEIPDGKLIVVEFTILDGAKMDPEVVLDFTKANVQLDEFEIFNVLCHGAELVEVSKGSYEARLVGTISVLFDVPEDYDLSQAKIMICGEEAVIPELPEEPEN